MPTNRFLLSGLAAIAGLAILVAWLSFGPAGTHVGEAAPPSPVVGASTALLPSPSPVELPSASPALALGPSMALTAVPIPPGDSSPGSPLRAGARYYTPEPFPVRVSFLAPSGWAGNVGGPNAVWAGPATTGDALSFQLNLRVFDDPCHPDHGTVPQATAPTVNELVQAITSRPGLAKAAPTPTTLGGRPAMSFRLALGGPLRDCGAFVLWELPLGATNELQAGVSERVWVVEADGQPLIVLATDAGNATASQRQGIQQALDSIEFDTGS